MSWFTRAIQTLRSRVAAGSAMDRRFDEEVEYHIEQHVARAVAAGLPADEARRQALVAFGGRQRFQEDARDEYRSRLLHELQQDLRYGLRALRHAPGFAAAVILSLALGVGATTVIFSVADHVVLRPLPYSGADRLVFVREHIEELPKDLLLGVNASHFLEWERACTACTAMAAMRTTDGMALATDGEPEMLGGLRVSPSLFPMLGATAALGRLFSSDDDQPGRNVVVLTDGFWRRRFGADPSIVGKSITIRGAPWTVVGVLPRDFWFPKRRELGRPIAERLDIFVPLALDARERTTFGEYDYAVIAQLAPQATPAQVTSQVNAVEAIIAQRSPDKITLRADAVPLQEQIVGPTARALLLLLAAVGAVLLIVCVNLANLLLARNAGRMRESAVRVALGAVRGRLMRQAFTESLVLAVAGGALGVLLSRWGLAVLLALAPRDLPRLDAVRLDGRVLAMGLFVSMAAAVAFGTLPARRFGRVDPADALKSGARGGTDTRHSTRGRALLIASQTGFSTLLLVIAGLFLSSFVRVLRVDKGFTVERVLALNVTLPPREVSRAAMLAYYEEALRRVAALPGVTATALTTQLPLEGESQVDELAREFDDGKQRARPTANIRKVSPGYFSVLGTPLRRGRMFADSDRGRSVVILSERAARELWPGEDPIGKRVIPGSNDPVAEVVGVVADIHTSSLEREGSLIAYLPHWQRTWPDMSLLVRTTGDPASMTAATRAELRAIDSRAVVSRVRTMQQIMTNAIAQRRFQVALLTIFAIAALATASVGIYGIISHALNRRRSEIGIRMALGARPADVHRLVLREGLRPVVLGLIAGIAVSLAVGRTIASLLYGVRSGDPITLGAVAMLLLLVGTAACLIPARRATGMAAADILRSS
jgi:putative ABC transport system permease protein